jgi:integrase
MVGKMPRKLPPNVERNHVKGRTYLSFRVGRGPRIRLPDDPKSDEFKLAYADAMANGTSTARRTVDDASAIGALIASYKRSTAYTKLGATTKVSYGRAIEALRAHSHRNVKGLTRERIENIVLRPYADRPGAAFAILKMLRILIRHALALDARNPLRLASDPSIGISRPSLNEIRSWTDAETAAFERCWPVGTKQRTAYAIMLFVGTARVDTHLTTWTQFDDEVAAYRRSKTGVAVDIGVDTELATALAAWPRTHVTIINTEYGKPFTVDGFSRFMRDAMTKAGLPLDCKPHGLRKTLGRRLADAGCTAHEIMAALGHKTLAEAERYTREADRRRGGRTAIKKLAAHRAGITQTNVVGLGKSPK